MMDEKIELSEDWEDIEEELGVLLKHPFGWISSELEKSMEKRSGADLQKSSWIRVKRIINITKFLDNNSIVRFPK